MAIAEKIYEDWHRFAKGGNTDGLISLYAEDAEFESPLVPIIMKQENGVLTGRDEIRAFLEEETRRRPNEIGLLVPGWSLSSG